MPSEAVVRPIVTGIALRIGVSHPLRFASPSGRRASQFPIAEADSIETLEPLKKKLKFKIFGSPMPEKFGFFNYAKKPKLSIFQVFGGVWISMESA
jgi:hypothetical protein